MKNYVKKYSEYYRRKEKAIIFEIWATRSVWVQVVIENNTTLAIFQICKNITK